MEKITKEELLKTMNMSAMSDEELEKIAGGEENMTYDECIQRVGSELGPSFNSCKGDIVCQEKCYGEYNKRVRAECAPLL